MSSTYRPFPPVPLPDRTWPSRVLDRAPAWCSVDLRDGNQALPRPMDVATKLAFFQLLTRIGLTQIEVGFPSAATVEAQFVRHLIEQRLIPPGVTIQVLTQARPHLIDATLASLQGAPRAIFHLYNNTSPLHRRVVFGLEPDQVVQLAVSGVRRIRHGTAGAADSITLEYSPESFSATEPEFSLRICSAVLAEWQVSPNRPVILNLPATVETTSPNVYADQIEWLIRHLDPPPGTTISVHTHNDRGTGIAATELALLAGATRVEGTLFGNGERTGNADLVTLALNLRTQGIDPGLDLSDLPSLVAAYEAATGMTVPPRHPYAGELVFTAFSGSHQDAIAKGMAARGSGPWEVPYLTIDPTDLGRSFEAIVRINSQSGKGGVAFVLAEHHGVRLPRAMQPEVGAAVQLECERAGTEVSPAEIWAVFRREYLEVTGPVGLQEPRHSHDPAAWLAALSQAPELTGVVFSTEPAQPLPDGRWAGFARAAGPRGDRWGAAAAADPGRATTAALVCAANRYWSTLTSLPAAALR